jgi:hypothetical protein
MRLKVGDIVLDQFKNTIIAQNYEVNSFGDITTRNGGFTNDFSIPLTSKNEEALGFPSDLNISTREPYEKVSAQLVDAGTVIALGYLRYKIIEDNVIKCSFFSTNTEWFNLIKDKKMTELDLSDYDHVWDYSTIADAIDADKISGYIYPIIDYGYFKDETLIATQLIPSDNLFPGIFVHNLVTQIFKDIGWTLNGELVAYQGTNAYGDMIQPFSNSDYVKSSSYLADNSIVTTENGTPDLTNDPTPLAINVNWLLGNTDILTILVTDSHNIEADLNYFWESDSGASGNTMDIKLFNGVVLLDSVVHVLPAADETFNITLSFSGALTIGDSIFVELSLQSANNPNQWVRSDDGSISIIPEAELIPGSIVQMAATMPDMLQTDFLKYIFFCFGVIPQPNNYSKVLTLDLFKTIEDNIPLALDWSGKLDTSKRITKDFTELLNGYSRVSILNYDVDDDDPELSAYKAETQQNFGQGQFDINNAHLDPLKEIYTAPYVPMININSFTNTMYIPQIKFYDDPDTPGTFTKEFEPKPKIGLMSSNITLSLLTSAVCTTFRIHLPGDVATFQDVTSVPFTWFAKTAYIATVDALTDSLVFGQILFPNIIGTTLKATYLQDQEDILNDMKYVKAFFKLDESDINNLDFMIPVYIDRFKSYFYINKVKNYQGSTKTTEVELVRIGNV